MDKWQSITDTNGGQPCNLLEAFYRNPERYAYTFQNYVFVTRLMQASARASLPLLYHLRRTAAQQGLQFHALITLIDYTTDDSPE